MAIDTQRISLDVSKQPAIQVVRLGQGDANGTTLVCAIYDEGQAYDLTGKTVRLRIQLPGGYAEYHVDGAVSGNEATFNVNEAYAASVAGITDNAYVEVIQGGAVVCSTSRFRVVILPSAYEGTDPAHIWDNGVNAFLQSANAQVRELTQDAAQAIAAAQSAESAAAAQLDAALDALGDISEIAVPEMSSTTRGGAKLGSGLAIADGKLRTQLVQGGQGIANTPIQADGDLLHGATVDGMSVQDGTPTPSAPVPIQVVETANLQPWPTSGTYSSGGASIVYGPNGDVITVASSTTANVWGIPESERLNKLIHLMPGTYVVTCPDNLRLMVRSYDGGTGTWTSIASNARSPYTLTLQEASDILCMYSVPNGTSTGTYEGWVMLNEGTTPQPYVPYGSLGLCVRGRNLLGLPPASINVDGGVLFQNNGNNSYTISGTATRNTYIYLTNNSSNFQLPAGTYTISALDKNGNAVPNVNVGASRWVNGSNTNYGSAPGIKTFTHTGEGNVQLLVSVSANKTVVKSTVYVQLETGSEATAFVPYVDSTTPIPLLSNVLASLPDGTHDELFVDELGGVKLVKRVGVVHLDGTETWAYATGANDTVRYRVTLPGLTSAQSVSSSTVVGWIMSDRFKTVCDSNTSNSTGTYNGEVGVSARLTSSHEVWFCHENESVDNWKTWLVSNNVAVYYKLATPTTIDLGTIDPPALADGSTVEVLANLDTGVSADWWAVGAGAVGDGLVKLRDMLTALGAGE